MTEKELEGKLEKVMDKFEPIEALPDLESARFYWKRFCVAIRTSLGTEQSMTGEK